MGWNARDSVALAIVLVSIAIASCAHAQADSTASQNLTTFLRAHRFPLVGASVTHAGGGATQVILYGYVATEAGKGKAAARVADYYHNDPSVTVANRISVNPEIRDLSAGGSAGNATANGPPDSGVPAGAATYGHPPASGGVSDETTWEQVYQAIQKYGVHQAPDPGGASAPW